MSVSQQLSCSTCTWNQLCIHPPLMTTEEVKAKMEEELTKAREKQEAEVAALGVMLSTILYAGKDLECTVCPVFAAKLRDSSDLSSKIKELMKSL